MRNPEGPQDLTPQWLTYALREGGTIEEATVLSFQVQTLGQEMGIQGRLVRLHLEYDRLEEGAPRRLVAKFPGPGAQRVFRRASEVVFYQQIANQIEMPTPRCYYAHVDTAGWPALLLEDLSPARSGDTITRDSLPKAEHAIRELAGLHAAWWEDPRLDGMDWLGRFDGARVEPLMEPRWDPFLQRAGHRLPDKTVIDRLRKQVAHVYDRLYYQAPLTLNHGDYQSNNLFFATPQGGVPFAVIDWQNLSHGCGTGEVAFYLGRGAPPEERRAVEMGLLETYHATLVENGVQGYTLERCIEDYRLSMLGILTRVGYVIAARLSPVHQRRFIDVLLPRAYAAVCDLDAVALLPE